MAAATQTKHQQGAALVISMIMLAVVTLLGVHAMRGLGLGESAAGGTLDKQRAFQAAEGTLRYAEWWLARRALGLARRDPPGDCDDVVDGNDLQRMRVCTQPIDAASLPWRGHTTYTPRQMVVAAGGGAAANAAVSGDVNYAATPQLHIADMGLGPYRARIFQVSAAGFGGHASTVSVVQGTFSVRFHSVDLGAL